jgi:hypothetical protein
MVPVLLVPILEPSKNPVKSLSVVATEPV